MIPTDAGASAPEPPPAPLLDADALAKLRELDPDGSLSVVQRVLGLYQTSLQRRLGELDAERRCDSGGSIAAVLHIAHTLKSSSASVGALGLADACQKFEQGVRSGTPINLQEELERLLAQGRLALQAVEAMLRP